MPVVVQLVPVLLLPPVELLGVLLWPLSQARVEHRSFIRDEMFLMFNNLGDQESELLCPPNSVEQWDLFLQCYFLLLPKILHVALMEQEGAIVDSLHVVWLSNQQVRSADYLRMQSVTACNDTCIRGD